MKTFLTSAGSGPERRVRMACGHRIAALLVLMLAGVARAATLNEPMTGTTAPGWVIGGSAYLTASTGLDAPGDGWLRLTDPLNDQAGYGYFNNSFDITQGGVVQFDYATYGGSGADGYSIFLFDAATTFSVGASGGSLGYAQKTVAPINPGMAGGYIGIGIDEFGNFSNPSEGRIGGPGVRANAVTVRGPYNHPSGAYYYLGDSGVLGTQLAFNGQAYRPSPLSTQYRKVVIYLTPVAAPNYLRVDVYLQFGYAQPLTQVVTGLMVGRPIPTNVKVGYAASTGGSTNYHEIRNLVINPLPTDIDLAVTKQVSSASIAQNATATYTVIARNYGPNLTTVSNVPVQDSIPTQLTGVTWTCLASGGASCGSASGSGNTLNTTATLPFNSAATYTITGTVNPTTTAGTVINNTATIVPPGGVTDYNSFNDSSTVAFTVTGTTVTVSGYVYSDANHNGVNNSEPSTSVANIYAKIFRSNNLTTAVAVSPVIPTASGLYTISGVPSYGTYTIILSTTNTTTFDPSFPSGNWIYTSPENYTLDNVVVSNTALANQNFGLYNGSRISGRVIKDDGANGSAFNANDGILNASETGISGVTVRLQSSGGGTTYDTTTTDSTGAFALYTNTASATLRITETNPANYTSVNFNRGTTDGTYTIASDYISFTYTLYTDYSGVLFSDVPSNTFSPTPLTSNGTALTPVYYAHTFTAGSSGTVAFTTNSRTQGSWAAVAYFQDNNCNGTYEGTDTAISGSITVATGGSVCILVRDTIPSTATNGTTDAIVTRATFTYANSGGITSTTDVTDTTTVVASNLSTSTKTWVDLNGGDQEPGDIIQYTITLIETAGVAASGVSVTDNIPANVSNFGVVTIPSGSTNSSTGTGGTNNTGYLNVTNISVPASSTRTIVFNVTIATGTAAGTDIDNTATITNPAGPGASAVAATLTVSESLIPVTGTKPLYLYGASTYVMSRTPTPSATSVVINGGNASRDWTLPLASSVTLSPTVNGNVVVNTYMTGGNRSFELQLRCSSGGTTLTSGTRTANLNGSLRTYNLPLSANLTCAANWIFTVINRTTGSTNTLTVYGLNSGNRTTVRLPSLDVIGVTGIQLYSNVAYPGGTVLAASAIAPGVTVRIRATITDPFGSYDITAANISITDSGGTVRLSNQTMGTQVYDSGAATKIYEYVYTIPIAGPVGNWLIRVTGIEGTETPSPATDFMQVALPVTRPTLTLVKSADKATAAPGATIQYTIVVTNTGDGIAQTVVLSDMLSGRLSFKLNSFQFTDGSPACGVTLGTPTYTNNNGTTWTYSPTSGGGGAPAGYDGNVNGWTLPLTGSVNANGANCTVRFDTIIK